ncbi:MAG TPA: ATP-binding cassette domain-containing protein [Flavobacterium sp.]|jgi:phospholipid/cholesterol/gamma-HCH transport system ATP-binding protein
MEDNSNDTAIEVRDLRKQFGGLEVLKGLTLDLKKQENLVVLGKSGTGKSVLIKCIVRLLDPDSGSIKVFGQDVTSLDRKELAEIRKKIGFLFQSAALYDSMTVRQNLEFPLRRIKKGMKQSEIDAKVMEVLENVSLPEAIDKMPSELSGGQRKRIGLARTIIVDPEIMLYDEPTTGLDPVTSNEISELINDIQKRYKTSSIIITHDIECAKTVGDRFIMLKEGEVYKDGSLAEFEADTDPFVSAFFSQNQNIK